MVDNIIMLSGDVDTNAAIACALGAHYGILNLCNYSWKFKILGLMKAPSLDLKISR